MQSLSPYILSGPAQPLSPIVVSIPHAGRYYPPELLSAARVSATILQRLEDRYVDHLAKRLGEQGYRVITATYARAWIDLNRAEDEWDSLGVEGGVPAHPVAQRVHHGLGIIPRRLYGPGELWRRRFTHAELMARIHNIHRPYHAAITQALAAAVALFGRAVLIDLHSMPRPPGGTPQIVLGDRHGLTASLRLVDAMMAAAEGQGFQVARNAPYAGAHTIERHAISVAGQRRIEAVQIEIDRSLYLDGAMEPEAPGLYRMRQAVERIVATAACYAMPDAPFAQAAE